MPLYCQHIMVIDAISKAYRVIDLKKEEVKEAFASIHFYKNYAFFQPLKYSCLVRFNMKTEELDYVENYRDFNVIKNDIDGDMLNVRLAKGDMFYAFNTDGTKIMELNLMIY